MEEQEAPVQPGDVLLGKYRVESILGQGGMGVVVAARHVDLGELFAIKFLLPKALRVPEAMERFLREARSSARLKGEHVAKVHDVGRLENDMPYMVMEYLTGTDLKAHVRKFGPLPVDEAIDFVVQTNEALSEAHTRGIVHRDLKPSNIFLTHRHNGTPCIKVLDFGIAKEISSEGADLTNSRAMLGSPLYMSPEQMLRSKSVDARTDIWSMGIVLYELLTAEVPFGGETLTEIVGRVLQSEPTLPSKFNNAIPPWLDQVILRCLQKQPAKRFNCIEELSAALQSGETWQNPEALDTIKIVRARTAEIIHANTATTDLESPLSNQADTTTTPYAKDASNDDAALAETAPASNAKAPSSDEVSVTKPSASTREETASDDSNDSDDKAEPPSKQRSSKPKRRRSSAQVEPDEKWGRSTLGNSTWGTTSGDERPRGNRSRAITTAALALAMIGGVAVWLMQRAPAEHPTPPPVVESAGSKLGAEASVPEPLPSVATTAPTAEPTAAPTAEPSAEPASSAVPEPSASASANAPNAPKPAPHPHKPAVKPTPPAGNPTAKATKAPPPTPSTTATQPSGQPNYEGVY